MDSRDAAFAPPPARLRAAPSRRRVCPPPARRRASPPTPPQGGSDYCCSLQGFSYSPQVIPPLNSPRTSLQTLEYHSPLEGESQKPEPNGEGFCGGGFAPVAPNGAVLCAVAGSHQPTYTRRPMRWGANAAPAGSTPGGLPYKKRGLEDPDPFQERRRRANRRNQAVAFSFLPPRPFTSIFFGRAAGARGAVISSTPLWKEAEILSRSVPLGKSRVCSYLP